MSDPAQKYVWQPQIGPQTYALTCPADVIFFGGERGGGKSDTIIGRQITGAMKYGRDWNGLVVRRKFKDLAELRRRIDQLIARGLPATRVGSDQGENLVRFANGAVFKLTAINRVELLDDFQGHQYTEIDIDEATNFPFVYQMIDKLKGCLRSAAGVPCQMFLSGNPGGPGHVAIKTLFILPNPKGMEVFYDTSGDSCVFIPSGLKDNRILCDNDPKYVNRLRSIRDPVLRAAWLNGDWDAFIGQAFNFSTTYHMIDPVLPRSDQPLYMTFDWGYGKPFSIGWWFVDSDNRVIRFHEWYGCEPDMPDTGLRLTDGKIAEGILEREHKLGITGRKNLARLSGPDCFSKKPDYQGGGQGPSTAEVFAGSGIYLTKGDPTRDQKIRQFRERLVIPDVGENGIRPLPMLVVTSDCRDFIRTIPSLAMDENRPEDIDTDQEDHIYDEACHICMARPMGLKIDPNAGKGYIDKRLDDLEKPYVDPSLIHDDISIWDRELHYGGINTVE